MELAIALMILLIVVAISAIKLSDSGLAFPFKRKISLFSQTERHFIDLIEAAVGSEYRLLCRVKLSDIVALRQNTDKKTAKSALFRASGRQLDFVLCSREDMSPAVAIDLVHLQGKDGYKTQPDYFVNGALDAAHIPHLRIKVKKDYTVNEIRECIETKIAPIKRKQIKPPMVHGTLNPDNPLANKPKRPIRSSRPVAA